MKILVLIIFMIISQTAYSQEFLFQNREVIFHRGVSKNIKAPLFLILHGGRGDGEKMVLTGFNTVADAKGFLVAYPEGKMPNEPEGRWNDGRSTYVLRDDVKYIKDLIEHFIRNENADPQKIFIVGASNGGMMTHRLACELPIGMIAGISPVIANMPDKIYDTCVIKNPISYLAIYGKEDRIVPMDGGLVCPLIPYRFCPGGIVVSKEKSWEKYYNASQCKSIQTNFIDKEFDWNIQVGKNCIKKNGMLIIENYGHNWPKHDFTKRGSQRFEMADFIADFFLKP